MFTLRCDMRAPEGGAAATALYATAIDEAAAYICAGRPLPLLPLSGGVPWSRANVCERQEDS